MLTRLNSQRVNHLQQAAELVSFAIEASTARQNNGGGCGRSGRTCRSRGGRIPVADEVARVDGEVDLSLELETLRRAYATNALKWGI